MKNLPVFTMLGALLLATFSFQSAAADAAVVQSLQMPAWLERNKQLQALRPGMVVRSGDTLITGLRSRVALRLGEGSDVHLGERVRFQLGDVKKQQGIFQGALNLIQGAFRFTTNALAKTQQRDLKIGIGAVTVGIRGTDIWGKATSGEDTLVLIEGEVSVRRDQQPEVIMDQALSFYQLDKQAPVAAATPVDLEQLKVWAAETALTQGAGVISNEGSYRVYLMSFTDGTQVDRQVADFSKAGYFVETVPAEVNGKQYIRLSIGGLISFADARGLKQRLQNELGLKGIWIAKDS